MKKINICVKLLLIIFLFTTVQIISQPKIYIVRHSEKIDDWPSNQKDFQPLSKIGIETSKSLAGYFEKIPLSAIYSSPLKRTMQTADFVSRNRSNNIEIEYACNDTSLINSFIEYLNENFNNDENVLIVSHSDIIPYFLIKLGLTDNNFDEMDFSIKDNSLLTDYYGFIFIVDQNKNSNKIYREKF